jgi:hypothetical protein
VTIPIRLVFWAWGAAVDDLAAFCLPSLAQANNVPWLERNGYSVALDFYTLKSDEARVRALAEAFHLQVRGSHTSSMTASISVGPDGLSDTDAKCLFFINVSQQNRSTGSNGIFAFGDRFFGDGSIRNIVTYAKRPGMTVGGLHLRVDRELFHAGLARHASHTAGAPVTNSRLTDIALDSLVASMKASFVDNDTNASLSTGAAIRELDNDMLAYTSHALLPMLFSFEQRDLDFFARFQNDFPLFHHIWPSMLIAQNRWRMLASSDLFCVAEVHTAETPRELAQVPQIPGMRFNDEFNQEHLRGRIAQTTLIALRRERLA